MKLNFKNIKLLFIRSFKQWNDNNAASLGASLAYYTVFSLAPLLIIAISVAGLLFDQNEVRDAVLQQSQSLYGESGQAMIEGLVNANSGKQKTNILTAIVGIITLLFGALGVFDNLQQSLNILWESTVTKAAGWWAFVRQKLLSFGMVLVIGFLLLISLAATAVLSVAGEYFSQIFGAWITVAQVFNFVLSFGIIAVLFMLMYKFLPNRKLLWVECLLGGVITALLFTLGKYLMGLYLGNGAIGSSYGAAGAVILILIWVYYSAQIFYFGACFTYVYAQRFGSLRK